MDCLYRQIMQADRRGDLTFADILRDAVIELERQAKAVRDGKKRARNIVLVDKDF